MMRMFSNAISLIGAARTKGGSGVRVQRLSIAAEAVVCAETKKELSNNNVNISLSHRLLFEQISQP